jgi:hypothetical protein
MIVQFKRGLQVCIRNHWFNVWVGKYPTWRISYRHTAAPPLDWWERELTIGPVSFEVEW